MVKFANRPNNTIKNFLGFPLLLLLLALLATIFSPHVVSYAQSVQATTVTETLSTSTGNLSVVSVPGLGTIYVEITYTIQGQLTGPSYVVPGSTYNYSLTLEDAEVTLAVTVAGQTFTASQSLPLGQQVTVPVPVGEALLGIPVGDVDVVLTTTATADVNVSGEATANAQTLQFPNEGTQTFSVTVDPNLSGDTNVTVTTPVTINIEIVKVSIPGLVSYSLNQDIGAYGLSPALSLSSEPLYRVEFVASGIGNGVPWSVSVNGNTYTSTNSTITVLLPYGTYSYSVSSESFGYAPLNASGTVSVSHNDEVVRIQFVQESTTMPSQGFVGPGAYQFQEQGNPALSGLASPKVIVLIVLIAALAVVLFLWLKK